MHVSYPTQDCICSSYYISLSVNVLQVIRGSKNSDFTTLVENGRESNPGEDYTYIPAAVQ